MENTISDLAVNGCIDYLAYISCVLGNDSIDNIPNIGPAKLFGTGGCAHMESIINVIIGRVESEEKWLKRYKSSVGADNTLDAWSACRNLIMCYPVFVQGADGNV
jgi:hypothetical protein